MLLNNLDPEVAEHPEQLIVYGGSGRAARCHDALRAIVRELLVLGDDETLLVQSRQAGRRLHHARGRATRADRQLAPRAEVGDLGRVPPARGARPDDVRPDDGRLVDLHRHKGILQGTYQTFAAAGERTSARPTSAVGRSSLPGSAGWAGATARGDDGRRRDPLHRGRRVADRAAARGGSSTRQRTRSTTRSRACGAGRGEARALGRSARERGGHRPELVSRGEDFDLATDQTAAHDPLNGYVPQGLSVEEARDLRGAPTRRVPQTRSRIDRPSRRSPARVRPAGYVCFRLWQQPQR